MRTCIHLQHWHTTDWGHGCSKVCQWRNEPICLILAFLIIRCTVYGCMYIINVTCDFMQSRQHLNKPGVAMTHQGSDATILDAAILFANRKDLCPQFSQWIQGNPVTRGQCTASCESAPPCTSTMHMVDTGTDIVFWITWHIVCWIRWSWHSILD